ncbi:MAG: Ger(x)C family spore germination protein [Clostridia bacterium]|nr:Ger(x)C family spore germination protein [Clostridia bacterium]
MNGRLFVLLLLICLLATSTGCWNNTDLTEIAICTALGIDRTLDDKIMVSVQIVKPSAARSSGKEGGGGTEGGKDKSFVVVSNTADTVFGALREMLNRLNKKIFYNSTQVIVIGEEAAESGINEYLDFFERDHESQYKADVVVAKGITAKKILEQEYDLANVPGAYISDTLKNTSERGMVKRTLLIDAVKEISSEQKQLALGTILKVGDTTETNGTAVFKKGNMVGWLGRFDTRGYLFATGRVESTILELPSLSGAGKYVGIELIRSNSKMNLRWKNGTPGFVVKIEAQGNIGEQHANDGLKEQNILEKLIPLCNEKIKSEVMSAVSKCRNQFKSDIFGFGEALYKNNPNYWNAVQKNWNEAGFLEAEIIVEVDTKLFRSGLLKETVESR